MGDDGFGIAVVEGLDAGSFMLATAGSEDDSCVVNEPEAGPSDAASVRIESGGTAGMALLRHFLESDTVIVIDALAAGAEPGAIFRFHPDEAGVMNLRSNNIHGMGVPHLVTNARLKGADPEVLVFAVQVESVNPRDGELSPAVAASVRRVREMVVEEVERLLAG